MNRINTTLAQDKKLISIYFTAGYPQLEDTTEVIKRLSGAGTDVIEIGLPYSDPLADGPVIQKSSEQALRNGMSTQKLFHQLQGIRDEVDIPLIVMGYFNAMLQFGVEKFCKECEAIGIDGIIMPDLPIDIFERDYKALFETHGLKFVPLITPETSVERIQTIDALGDSFVYMVSSSSTTGGEAGFGEEAMAYFKRIADMELKNKLMVGFGIKDALSFEQASRYTSGCIIGSEFIRRLTNEGMEGIAPFVKSLK
ncbi:tryptophan synthase subunit alpha [Psychroflexus montanilacus]|uniref:tryptophan synthase subunit alpha n=1 Tax=Psychroflexus montanilacus TaxID=2873598 RepID=UPI001CCF79DF|nr:tryptophan synthase subunit alpha [Psychroflexus montanilacus]MBZ9652121.1 tryptophan synthase subunit alpha [Psychroflexus montanilacus]